MPTIDDWNADIAKDEEESDSNREYKGRGGGRGGGGRGRRGDSSGYRGRGGKDFGILTICVDKVVIEQLESGQNNYLVT